MTERTHSEIVEHIVRILNEYVTPVVEQHGGVINFINFEKGIVIVELSGACSGCAGSYFTLRNGVENMLRNMVPEVTGVEGIEDPHSTVNPFYSDPFSFHQSWDISDIEEIDNESDN